MKNLASKYLIIALPISASLTIGCAGPRAEVTQPAWEPSAAASYRKVICLQSGRTVIVINTELGPIETLTFLLPEGFQIWDMLSEDALLVRDRFGQKPTAFTFDGRGKPLIAYLRAPVVKVVYNSSTWRFIVGNETEVLPQDKPMGFWLRDGDRWVKAFESHALPVAFSEPLSVTILSASPGSKLTAVDAIGKRVWSKQLGYEPIAHLKGLVSGDGKLAAIHLTLPNTDALEAPILVIDVVTGREVAFIRKAGMPLAFKREPELTTLTNAGVAILNWKTSRTRNILALRHIPSLATTEDGRYVGVVTDTELAVIDTDTGRKEYVRRRDSVEQE